MNEKEHNQEVTAKDDEESWQETLCRATGNLEIVRTTLIGLEAGDSGIAPDLRNPVLGQTVESLVRLIDSIHEDLGIVLG